MCGCAKYTEPSGKVWTVCFPSPKAALPVFRTNGFEWIKWGKRKEENAPGFVNGGWARIDSIEAGKWNKLQPQFVLLGIQSFMEKDAQRQSHWVAVPDDQAVQGIVVTHNEEHRLYVVTEPTPPAFAWVHDRWPRLVDR